MTQVTNDDLNTLVLAAFRGTFGSYGYMNGLLAKVIARHKDDIRNDIKKLICKSIDEIIQVQKGQGFKQDQDFICWAVLLEKLKDE